MSLRVKEIDLKQKKGKEKRLRRVISRWRLFAMQITLPSALSLNSSLGVESLNVGLI